MWGEAVPCTADRQGEKLQLVFQEHQQYMEDLGELELSLQSC